MAVVLIVVVYVVLFDVVKNWLSFVLLPLLISNDSDFDSDSFLVSNISPTVSAYVYFSSLILIVFSIVCEI